MTKKAGKKPEVHFLFNSLQINVPIYLISLRYAYMQLHLRTYVQVHATYMCTTQPPRKQITWEKRIYSRSQVYSRILQPSLKRRSSTITANVPFISPLLKIYSSHEQSLGYAQVQIYINAQPGSRCIICNKFF